MNSNQFNKVLAIETSCDETAVAIYDGISEKIIAESIFSQIECHTPYGGVVPELAAREHSYKLAPMVDETLKKSSLKPTDIDGIAYTQGPGLMGPLLVGASFAQGLAQAWDLPIIGIHHMEGHLLAPMLEKPIDWPFLSLLVSGGHTLLVKANKLGNYEILGESLDDAVGEAFDKTAKLIGLNYPGGPELSKLAQKGKDRGWIFPRPMTNRPGLMFSFSGLKTHAVTTWESLEDKSEADKADLARAFEIAACDTLIIKCRRAIEQTGINRLVVAGGVSANKTLRSNLEQLSTEKGVEILLPSPRYCTDNAAMIALGGFLRLNRGEHDSCTASVKPRWSLQELD